MGLILITPPPLLPITVQECRRQCRIEPDDASEDFDLEALAMVAVSQVETDTRRQLLEATYLLTLRCWRWPIVLPRPPTIAVESIEYIDPDGATQELTAGDDYLVDLGQLPAQITRGPDFAAPALDRRTDAVRVTFRAGYGAAASAVPPALRQATLLWVSHLRRYRGDEDAPAWPAGVAGLLRNYVIPVFDSELAS